MKSQLIGIWALVFATTLVNSEEPRPVSEYLPEPSKERHSTRAIDLLSRNVDLHGGFDVFDTKRYFELSGPNNEGHGNIIKQPIYQKLLITLRQLSEDREKEIRCSSSDVRSYVDIVSQVFGSLEQYAEDLAQDSAPKYHLKLFRYLRYYGIKHYTACLNQLHRLVGILYNLVAEFENKFDALVVANIHRGSNRLSDEDRLKVAQHLDFAKGIFDAKAMLKAAEGFVNKDTRADDLLPKLVSESCSSFRARSSDVIDIYNLQKLLSPKEQGRLKFEPKFDKLNEYTRLCLQVLNSRSGKVFERHVLKQLDWFKFFWIQITERHASP